MLRAAGILLLALLRAPVPLVAAPAMEAVSPDGRVRLEFALRDAAEGRGLPHYQVTFDGKVVVEHSRLAIDLGGGQELGRECQIESVAARSLHEQYVQVTGKRRHVSAHASELVITLREAAPPQRVWQLALRAFNDAAAFRYQFPAQEGWKELNLARERTEFRLPAEARLFALPLNGFTTSYEKRYVELPAARVPQDWLLGLPLLLKSGEQSWAAITEANVYEYAGMYLAHESAGLYTARLAPLPNEPGLAVRSPLPHASPWRVVMVADHPGRLIESDTVLNLAEPCALEDTSWIKTGKTTFPWWNGFHEESVGFTPGLNTATAKHYIDFCSSAGIPYHSLDGMGNTAWYGGPITPYQGADPTRAVEGLDLPEVLAYAKAKNVRLRLWMNWMAAAKFMEKAFPKYREWGIEGVMLDFMDRDDQEMNRFVRNAVRLAARNRLTVTLHGCPKPTGLERTYPNLLTHEGVMNLEYNKWDAAGITPDHELTVPFTRMLAGPLDFHQGSFRTVRPAEFKPRNEAPLVMGTPARTLASYVVFQNHLSMVADYPSAYKGHPGVPLLAAIPTTWDDTRVLDGAVAHYLIIARQSGSDWYLAAMTDNQQRALKVPLRFLEARRYRAEVAADDRNAALGLLVSRRSVGADDVLELKLSAGGGALVRLVPE
jgi:alpha-glucosidase